MRLREMARLMRLLVSFECFALVMQAVNCMTDSCAQEHIVRLLRRRYIRPWRLLSTLMRLPHWLFSQSDKG